MQINMSEILHTCAYLVLFIFGCQQLPLGSGFRTDHNGPRFTIEPTSNLLFSNSSGGRLDCSADGIPPPRIEWVMATDGAPVVPILGARLLFPNGSLVFPPFRGESFRPDVHSTAYRCAASNSAGKIVSLDVQVRAVVVQKYEARVYDVTTLPGNAAVLRCHVPTYVKDYLTITSWLQDDTFNIYPTVEGDSKYVMFASSGNLHILNVTAEDAKHSYRCRTLHKLTDQTQESVTAGQIILNEPETTVAPRISDKSLSTIAGRRGEYLVIPCVAQGYPPPFYWWQKKAGGRLDAVSSGERKTILGGSLMLKSVQPEDSGMYICSVNNTAGSASLEVEVVVSPDLTAHINPNSLRVDSGASVELTCVTTGNQVKWFKDGQKLVNNEDAVKVSIPSVQREDQGMYQCIASQGQNSVLAVSELRLSASKPQLVYQFIEQTLQPGPDVSLKCIATGQPTPQIQWTLDGFPIPQSERFVIGQYVTLAGDVISHVNITRAAVEDGGVYKCSATNRVGTASHQAPLRIYGDPIVRKMPPLSAVAGEPLYVSCPAAGYPIQAIVWEKDGRLLPVNHRQTVHKNGTLVIENVQQKADHGTYTCQVTNRQGISDSGKIEISVMVPPEITPFVFAEFTEGARIQVTCNVHRGDLPLNLTWLKDSVPILATSPFVDIIRFNMYSSILTMSNVGRFDSGNYTCMASNPAKTVSHTAALTISVPPEWTVEPRDTSVISGQTVALHCQANGFPQPQITWRKGKQSNQLINAEESLGNGTLVISTVSEQHEGHYLCEANNGIGAGLSAVVFLTVNELPRFISPSTQETVKKGGVANLLCESRGDKPIQITWKFDGIKVADEANFRYHIKESSTESTITSQLSVKQVTAKDSGKYVCFASNLFGTDETAVQLTVQDVPSAPDDVRITQCSSRALKVAWNEASDNNSPVQYYAVLISQSSEPWPDIPDSGDLSLWKELTNLQPSTTYRIRVVAVNKIGPGPPSNPLVISTDPEAPSSPPTNVTATSPNPHAVKVVWSPPPQSKRNGPILGYYVGIKPVFNKRESHFNFSTVKLDAPDAEPHPFIIKNLRSYTKYKVTVQPFNTVGHGPKSPEVFVLTRESAPAGAATNLDCIALTSESLQVTWLEPPSHTHNGVILGYKVYFEKVPLKNEYLLERDLQMKEVNEKLAVLSNLDKYSNYSLKVAAFTHVGLGPMSSELFCLTAEDVPNPPVEVTSALTGPQSCVVSWSHPSFPNGEIVQFNVYQRIIKRGESGPESKRPFLGTVHLMHVNNMQNHSIYEWWVTAVTKVGESGSSIITSLTPSSKVPAAIVSFGSLIVLPNNSTVYLDCQVVGSPRPKLAWSFEGQRLTLNSETHILPNGTLTVSSLTQANAGNYTCVAQNVHRTQSISYYLRIVVPPSHPALDVLSTTWNNITLMWSRPFNVVALLGYILHHRPASDGGSWKEIRLPSQIETYSVTGLSCGSKHLFTIAAFNRVGLGSSGPVLEVSTMGSAPVAPPNHLAVSSLSYSLTVHLERWQDGDCPLSHFVILKKQESENEWFQVSEAAPPGSSFIISGLDAATVYRLLIKAVNNAGTTSSQHKVSTLTVTGAVHFEQTDETLDSQYVQKPFYLDTRYSLPIFASFFALFVTLASAALCLRSKPGICSSVDSPTPTENGDLSKPEYYAALQQKVGSVDQQSDRIPEYEDEIYPYATFQVAKPCPNAVSRPRAFQTFVYQGAKNMGIDNYAGKDVINTYSRRLFRPDIDEYDSLGSDSDSRHDSFSAFQNSSIRHNKLVNALESSTSNEPSPSLDHRKKDRRWTNSPKKKNLVVLKNNSRSPITSETAFNFPNMSPKPKYYDDFCKPECDLQPPPIHYRV